MDDRAVSTVQTALAETRWLPVPCPPEYLPALGRDVLRALEHAEFAVVALPEPYGNGLEWPVDTLDGKVVIRCSDRKIANDGVRNPYPSPAVAHAHAVALLAAVAASREDRHER